MPATDSMSAVTEVARAAGRRSPAHRPGLLEERRQRGHDVLAPGGSRPARRRRPARSRGRRTRGRRTGSSRPARAAARSRMVPTPGSRAEASRTARNSSRRTPPAATPSMDEADDDEDPDGEAHPPDDPGAEVGAHVTEAPRGRDGSPAEDAIGDHSGAVRYRAMPRCSCVSAVAGRRLWVAAPPPPPRHRAARAASPCRVDPWAASGAGWLGLRLRLGPIAGAGERPAPRRSPQKYAVRESCRPPTPLPRRARRSQSATSASPRPRPELRLDRDRPASRRTSGAYSRPSSSTAPRRAGLGARR